MPPSLKSLLRRLRDAGNAKQKVKWSLPPYLLLGIIWWASSSADTEQNDAAAIIVQKAIAAQEFENARQSYEQEVLARELCINAARTRTNSRETFFAIIDEVTVNNQEINTELHAIVDENQPALSISDCDRTNPEPNLPIPPTILTED